ncbi:MAG: hypothetical protein ACI4B3_02730 [Prevotella sp.]
MTIISILLTVVATTQSAKIDRQAVLERNNPKVEMADPLSSLTVGNGEFAATIDVTGLQSFPENYAEGVPLTTMSAWGWHSFPNTKQLTEQESQRTVDAGHGREEVYAVEYKSEGRNKDATSYFRVNPHRLNLGCFGLVFTDAKGEAVPLTSISDIRQELKLWEGIVESSYAVCASPVRVTTGANGECLFAHVATPLFAKRQAALRLRLPYPTGQHSDDASDWTSTKKHTSKIVSADKQMAVIEHLIDNTRYYVTLRWRGKATLDNTSPHVFTLCPSDTAIDVAVTYHQSLEACIAKKLCFADELQAIRTRWADFWQSGGFVDFSLCTDPRAKELERRTVLSQYVTHVNCGKGGVPPQETGLTYNSWFGRPHLEMTWWHAVHFSLWNRPEVIDRTLSWYDDVALAPAREIARRQGFGGARWMKMTDPWAGEAPSNTGSFLTWQQPHYIYMAEEAYRRHPDTATLEAHAEAVEATAQFMADFALACDKGAGKPIVLHGQTAMQECMTWKNSCHQPFEQAYWRYGLLVAQQWRERMGKPRSKEWDDIISRMAPLAESEGIYVSALPIPNSPLLTPNSPLLTTDHPAVLGACGLLPANLSTLNSQLSPLYNESTMHATLKWVNEGWNWESTWGWDYGMIAMCAARLGDSEAAIDALLTPKQKNTYLVNGHNFQEPKRLRIYLPGNGALLCAVAMMCAGWDGCPNTTNPGFPKDGKWNVRWEGLNKMQ